MSFQPLTAEIMIFAGNFPPRGWARCDGQLMRIDQNSALFSLIGTVYGGDGKTTFGLPDLRGRMPMHEGDGPGLASRRLGQRGGQEQHTLTPYELPSHAHTMGVRNGEADATTAVGGVIANGVTNPPSPPAFTKEQPNETMNINAIGATGGGQPHDIMPPYLALTFCISLYGVYLSRT